MIEELCISTYSINTRVVESLTKWYDKGNVRSILPTCRKVYGSDARRGGFVEVKARDREISIVYA
ncbi:MAG: hypothetical protein ACLU4J_16955 [Butyricimonas paravirosa]